MASSPFLPNVFAAPVLTTVPRYEPYLVEVVLPFPVGAADEAVAAAAAAVKDLLASADMTGEPRAPTPETDDRSRRLATTAFVHELVELTLKTLLQTPGVLSGYLPKDAPAQDGLPYLSGGVVAITGFGAQDA
ncbi:hypothetical protein PUR23_19625 [Methylorubrum populi]|uniref:hypothetical protein n=1 Tax=Methylorubrum populi TaxID=223967 RepID=UPI0031F75F6C